MTQAVTRIEQRGLDASYSAEEMAWNLHDTRAKLDVVQSFFKEVMVKDQDYGVIPGTDKPALLKPGAEKLCELYGFAPTVKHVDEDRDIASGFFRARVTIALISKKTGETIAEGIGEANTHEGRYRWRWVYEDKMPPNTDTTGLVCQSGTKNGRSWKRYRMENDDPWSLWNTVTKMAKKRALVDATLSATRSSGLFTQDADALERWREDGEAIEGEYTEGPREPFKRPQPRSKANAAPPPPNWLAFWVEAQSLGLTEDKVRTFVGQPADVFDAFNSHDLELLMADLRKAHPQPALPS